MRSMALLVEGLLDEVVGRRILEHLGGQVSVVYGKRGIGYIQRKITGFNDAATGFPILTLADLMDTGLSCAAAVVKTWLPHRNESMFFRLAVREIESWLLADRANLAAFLKVPRSKIPQHPEQIEDPKRTLINLARRSRSATIRRNLVPWCRLDGGCRPCLHLRDAALHPGRLGSRRGEEAGSEPGPLPACLG